MSLILSNLFPGISIPTIAGEFVRVKGQAPNGEWTPISPEAWVMPNKENRSNPLLKLEQSTARTEALDNTPKDQYKAIMSEPTRKQPESVSAVPFLTMEISETRSIGVVPASEVAPLVQALEVKKPESPISEQLEARAATTASHNPFRGQIELLDLDQKFVVLDFPDENVPAVGTKLSVYRSETLVGNILVTNPVKPPFASADILSGNIQTGDTVH